MEEKIFTGILIAAPLVIFALLIWSHLKARKMVQRWAGGNNYKLLRCRFSFLKGPFYWRTLRKKQKVFRIKVQMEGGNIEKGYIQCGDWWYGILKHKVEVIWDKNENKKLL